jgi:hypothetical protein
LKALTRSLTANLPPVGFYEAPKAMRLIGQSIRALDDAAVMHRNCRIDQITAERSEPSEDAIFVGASEPTIADHVGDQNCRWFPRFTHAKLPCCHEANTNSPR